MIDENTYDMEGNNFHYDMMFLRYHRDNGPALKGLYAYEWWHHGKVHRLDGPAIEYYDGRKEWWVNNWPVTSTIKPWAEELGIDLDNLTVEDKVVIELRWGDYGK